MVENDIMSRTSVKIDQAKLLRLHIATGEEGRIAVFASGNGTNAENIALHFQDKKPKVHLIVTDNPSAGVIERAKRLGIEHLLMNREEITSGVKIVEELRKRSITLVVLAGYLGRVGKPLLEAFPDLILNIHPALLPKFGGKGMYGDHVHEAVLKNKEEFSGITIHVVNEEYDRGTILCQVTCPAFPEKDTVETLAQRIHRLEYFYYPIAIEEYLERL